MTPVLWWIIQEFVSILVLVVVVSVACLALRNRPAWRHALWLVVLVKFIIPPVAPWPWSLGDVVDRVMPASNAEVASTPLVDDGAVVSGVDKEQTNVFDDGLMDLSADGASLMDSSTDSLSLFLDEAAMAHIQCVLIGMWSVGCVFALAVQFRRLRRQGNIVCRGSPAPQPLVTEIERASREMNVRSVPVTVVSETASPFLWCLGRLRLVWPETLAREDALNRSRGMIAHELAHVRRRDHWVAWLGLAAGVIWWWNPLFWFVRRRVDESAEMACDAIALSVYEDRREYAEMFLEMSSSLGPGVPVLGIGASTPSSFERRMTMILSDRVSGALSMWGILFAGCIAAVFLPGWSLAQNAPSSKSGALAGPTTIVNETPSDASHDARGDAVKSKGESLPTTVIQEDVQVDLLGNSDGSLKTIRFAGEDLGSGDKAFESLSRRIEEWAGAPDRPKVSDREVEILADHNLNYEFITRAISVLTGKMNPQTGKVERYIGKVKFAPPRDRGELTISVGFIRDKNGNKLSRRPIVFWSDQIVRIDDVEQHLRSWLKQQSLPAKDISLILRADSDAGTGAIQGLIKQAQSAGFQRFALRPVQPVE